MITREGPKVLEFNCRWGDPEAEAVLPLIETDMVDLSEAIIDRKISEIRWNGSGLLRDACIGITGISCQAQDRFSDQDDRGAGIDHFLCRSKSRR